MSKTIKIGSWECRPRSGFPSSKGNTYIRIYHYCPPRERIRRVINVPYPEKMTEIDLKDIVCVWCKAQMPGIVYAKLCKEDI